MGVPEANDLLRQIERSFAGAGSATAGIVDALAQKPEGRRLNGGITVVETKRDQPGGGGQGVNPYPHAGSTFERDHLPSGLPYKTTARDWHANKARHTATITPECRGYLMLREVTKITTRYGFGREAPEAMPYFYQGYGKKTLPPFFLPILTAIDINLAILVLFAWGRGTCGRHLVLRMDGVRWKGVGRQTDIDVDTRGAVDRLYAEELAAAQLASAMTGAPDWLTPGIFLAWLMGDATPKALGNVTGLPSDKTVKAALAAACARVATAQASAALVRDARAALASGSPLLTALATLRRRAAAKARLHRLRQAGAGIVAVRAADLARQAAVRADDRRAWLGVPEPFRVPEKWRGEKLAHLSANERKRVPRLLRKERAQQDAERREKAGRAFAESWWIEHEHEVPPVIDEKPNYQRQAERRAQAPLSAQKPQAISEKGPWPFLEPCGPASYPYLLKEIAPCLSGSLVEQLPQGA